MSLQDLIAADRQNVLLNKQDHAVEVQYTPAGGSASPIDAIMRIGQSSQQEGEHRRHLGLAWVNIDDVPQPGYGDMILHDSVEWQVNQLLSNDGGMLKLEIETDVRPDY